MRTHALLLTRSDLQTLEAASRSSSKATRAQARAFATLLPKLYEASTAATAEPRPANVRAHLRRAWARPAGADGPALAERLTAQLTALSCDEIVVWDADTDRVKMIERTDAPWARPK